MIVRVNGEPRESSAATLRELLVELGYDPGRQGIAVAWNGEVVARGRWSEHAVGDGDEVEIVGAVQGG